METLDEVYQTTRDKYGLKANSLLSALEKFSMLFGLKLEFLILSASETLYVSIQGKDTEALAAVNLARAVYRWQKTEQAFSQFYNDVVSTAEKESIGEPQLPRYRRVPLRWQPTPQI